MIRHDIEVVRGDTWTRTFQYVDGTTGDPLNLTDYALQAQVRHDPDDTAVAATMNAEMVSAANGLFRLTLAKEDTAKFSATRRAQMDEYHYDVQATHNTTLARETLVSGRVHVVADVTR